MASVIVRYVSDDYEARELTREITGLRSFNYGEIYYVCACGRRTTYIVPTTKQKLKFIICHECKITQEGQG